MMEATLDHKVKTCYVVVVAASVVVAATRSCCCYTSCTLCSLRTEHSASLFSPEEERHPPYEQAPSSPSEAVLRGIPHRRAAIASLRSTQGTRQAAGHRNGKLHALFPLVFFKKRQYFFAGHWGRWRFPPAERRPRPCGWSLSFGLAGLEVHRAAAGEEVRAGGGVGVQGDVRGGVVGAERGG